MVLEQVDSEPLTLDRKKNVDFRSIIEDWCLKARVKYYLDLRHELVHLEGLQRLGPNISFHHLTRTLIPTPNSTFNAETRTLSIQYEVQQEYSSLIFVDGPFEYLKIVSF